MSGPSLLSSVVIDSETRITRLGIRFNDGSLYRHLHPQFAQAKSSGLISGYKLKPHGANGAIRHFNVLLTDPSEELLEGIQRITPRYRLTALAVQRILMLNGSPESSSVFDSISAQVVSPSIKGKPKLSSCQWMISDVHRSVSLRCCEYQGGPCLFIEVKIDATEIKKVGPTRLPKITAMDWSQWLHQYIAVVGVHKGRAGEIYRERHGLGSADPSTCRKTFNRYIGNRVGHAQYLMNHSDYRGCIYDQTHHLLP